MLLGRIKGNRWLVGSRLGAHSVHKHAASCPVASNLGQLWLSQRRSSSRVSSSRRRLPAWKWSLASFLHPQSDRGRIRRLDRP